MIEVYLYCCIGSSFHFIFSRFRCLNVSQFDDHSPVGRHLSCSVFDYYFAFHLGGMRVKEINDNPTFLPPPAPS
jgi:hypothetical protein